MIIIDNPILILESEDLNSKLYRRVVGPQPQAQINNGTGWQSVSLIQALSSLQKPLVEVKLDKSYDLSQLDSLVIKRHSGLGDAVFCASVLWQAKILYPHLRVYLDTVYEWQKWLFWQESPSGITAHFDADIINPPIDINLPRTQLIGSIFGLYPQEHSFPMTLPHSIQMVECDYNVLIPQAKNDGKRRLLDNDVRKLIKSGCWIILGEVDNLPEQEYNFSGIQTWETITNLLLYAHRIFSVDTGLGYFAGILGKSVVFWFTNIKPENRLLPDDNWAIPLHAKKCWGCEKTCSENTCQKIDCWAKIKKEMM